MRSVQGIPTKHFTSRTKTIGALSICSLPFYQYIDEFESDETVLNHKLWQNFIYIDGENFVAVNNIGNVQGSLADYTEELHFNISNTHCLANLNLPSGFITSALLKIENLLEIYSEEQLKGLTVGKKLIFSNYNLIPVKIETDPVWVFLNEYNFNLQYENLLKCIEIAAESKVMVMGSGRSDFCYSHNNVDNIDEYFIVPPSFLSDESLYNKLIKVGESYYFNGHLLGSVLEEAISIKTLLSV